MEGPEGAVGAVVSLEVLVMSVAAVVWYPGQVACLCPCDDLCDEGRVEGRKRWRRDGEEQKGREKVRISTTGVQILSHLPSLYYF